jgi:molybdenum ABC transporter molybdate-binding protein
MFFSCTGIHAAVLELYGAGSLGRVMGEMVAEYEKLTETKVNTTFGSSGKMREILEKPGTGDIFTSANMGHAQQLQKMGRSLFVAEFTKNVLCVFGNEKASVTDQNVLEKLLDPSLKVGIFPSHDPSGEYALLMFKRAEVIKPGAEKALLDKAVVMEADMVRGNVPEGDDFMSQLMREGTIDMYVAYASGTEDALMRKGTPVSSVGQLPDNLRVGVNYGLTVLKDAKPEAYQLALFILSERGQGILKKYGFAPIGLTD